MAIGNRNCRQPSKMRGQANKLVNPPLGAINIPYDNVNCFYVARQTRHRSMDAFLDGRGILSRKFDLTGYFQQHG